MNYKGLICQRCGKNLDRGFKNLLVKSDSEFFAREVLADATEAAQKVPGHVREQ
jgi:hypothetical protein